MDLGMLSSKCFDEVESTFHHGRIVKKLLQNEQFQELIATRLAALLEGPLSDEHMISIIEEMADSIRSEIVRDAARWDYPVYGWENAVADMAEFCDGRAKEMINSLSQVCHFTASEKEEYFGALLH